MFGDHGDRRIHGYLSSLETSFCKSNERERENQA